jgi:hypothetical protein
VSGIFARSRCPFLRCARCSAGFYGRPGETCLPCPIGGFCDGYISGVVVATGSGQQSTSAVHTYPVPLPGFYNLNGSMLGLCPPSAVVPGRDVCIVGCSPPDACVGANLCATGYASTPPNYRCSSCDKGFYNNGNGCTKCPDSPVMVIIGVVLIVIALACAGYFLSQKGINLGMMGVRART